MAIRSRIDHFKEKYQAKYQTLKESYQPMVKVIIQELWQTGKKPFMFAILAGIVLLILTPIFTYAYFVRDLSSKDKIVNRKNAGVILLDREDKPFFSFYEARTKKSISFDEIPLSTKQAVIAIEDRNFYKHPGFSLRSIGRALLTNIEQERITQGGSTISQQLVKNTLLSQDRNVLRKYQEIFLALEIERRFSKDDILEMYLNTVYFGEGAFGIEDAAHAYFGKNAQDLTLAESSLLAGILPAPSAYSPLNGDKEKAFQRQAIVLRNMQQQGYITETERLTAEKQRITFNPQQNDLNVQAPHFALMVKNELIERYGEQKVARSGFIVKTTLDLSLQKVAENAVENRVIQLTRNKASNGAAVAIDPRNGEILALVGSHDWSDENNGKINMVLSPRQPGSSFKPIVYAKAFEDRLITSASQIDDKPVTFPDGYKPKNYDGKYRDHVLVRFALANSLNIPSVHIMEKVGVSSTISFAERLGITTLKNPSRYGLSLVLGAAEVPLIEMTSAYGAFAFEGERAIPTTILQIQDKNKKVLYIHNPETQQVIDNSIAFLISSILSDNKARAEVFGNSLTISRPAAVKTGTSEDYRDALTIGYTPNLVVGVWVGNNDRTPMDSVAGSFGAAPIWRLIMEQGLRNTSIVRFNPPFSIQKTLVCMENGFRAERATSSAYMEYFLPGTLPQENCNVPTETPIPSPTDEPTPTIQEEQPIETPVPTVAETASPTPTITPFFQLPTGF